jgi:hypothetical protein
MRRRVVTIPPDRYLIFYEFDDDADEHEGVADTPEAAPASPRENDV